MANCVYSKINYYLCINTLYNMTKEEYIKQINLLIETLEENHNIKKAKSVTDNFYTDLKFDSLGLVELLMQAEFRFGIEVPDEVMLNILTVNDLINVIEKYKNI